MGTHPELRSNRRKTAGVTGSAPNDVAFGLRVANDFMKFSAAVETFGFCPVHDELYSMETQGIDLKSLEDAEGQAPQVGGRESRLSIGEAAGPIQHFYARLRSTSAERTCRRVFRGTDLGLSDADQQSYLRDVISAQMRHYPWLELSPLPEGDQVFPSVTISISHRRNGSPLRGSSGWSATGRLPRRQALGPGYASRNRSTERAAAGETAGNRPVPRRKCQQ